jgi:inosose dehydratase
MSQIQFGCQFYTWQMSGERYVGKLPHILKIINAAGFAGIEPETCMLGAYYEDPQALKDILIQHGLKPGALTLVLDWAEAVETQLEKEAAERIFETMNFFPTTHLVLCQFPGKDRSNLRQRQANAIACVNAVAKRAVDRGISCSFHPNSPPGSVFRTQDDYQILLNGLDSRVVGFAPDTGHIANGGMQVGEIFQTYRPLIKHVHFKDITAAGEWTQMGAGVIDFPQIVKMLKDTGYVGWIMIEEESPEAKTDPDSATNKNGKYMHQKLLPIVQNVSASAQEPVDHPTAALPTRSEPITYPHPGAVRITGRLSARFQGNLQYLENMYEKKKDWMVEPFQNRGQAWVIEPQRNKKGEQAWAGEYAGKWLDAAARAAESGDDDLLRRYATTLAAALAATQESDGYLGIESADRRMGNAEWKLWNIKYALTGLLTQSEVSQEKTALDTAIRCGEWLIRWYGPITDANHAFYQSPEDGGVSVMIVDELVRLYHFTNDPKFLNFAASIVDHFPPVLKMRTTCQAPLVHAYNFLGYLGGVVELLAAENKMDELQWVEKVWEDLVDRHLYPTGSLGYNELLRIPAPNDTPVENGQPERHHQETCATVEWLLLNSRLYQATGNVRYMEKMEQTIYNALLAAQSMDGMSWMYYTPLRYEKKWFSGPTSCCYWSGPRGIAQIPGWVYAIDSHGIRVNLYETSQASFTLKGHTVGIKLSSQYPDIGKATLQIEPQSPFSFALRLRIPRFSSDWQITLNGQPYPAELKADGYCSIERRWAMGDQVELEFGIPTVLRHFLSNQYGVLVHGAEVLAVDQRDNSALNLDSALDLDRLAFQETNDLRSLVPVNGRRRFAGQMYANDTLIQVVFTPYADCGGEGSRFRTAFPIQPGLSA